MNGGANKTEDFPYCLDMASLPPNHNRLIGAVPAITMDNVLGTLGLLQKITGDNPRFELNLGEEETAGLYALIENVREAVRFETYYRRRHEDRPATEPPAAPYTATEEAAHQASTHE